LPARQDEMQRSGIAEKALDIAESAAQEPFCCIHLKGAAALRAFLFNTKKHVFNYAFVGICSPQWLQNIAPGKFSAWQLWQNVGSGFASAGLPHLEQNLAFGVRFLPQFWHCCRTTC
jgi:hypothetical protein